MSRGIKPEDLVLEYSGERVFPFIEHDGTKDITGYGHQDRAAFAEAVNRYDRALTEWSNGWVADDVGHAWAVLDGSGDRPVLVAEGSRDAVPVTLLWGRR